MDKKFMALMLVFFLVFGVFVTTTLFNKQISNIARASTETDPSAQTSLIFAWPLTAKVGDKVEVNVFIRNANNLPLDKKPVKLVTNLGLVNGTPESTSESNKTGKVNFTLSSDTAGIAELTAFVNNNIQLIQKISVKFE
ncbi:Ig-like domain-containing protein [Candidatus Roizmanbacteria bacterium]|nr:Ig-like domain-containing protein [Candidatus Roizmanbacteria bacterium]